MKSRSLELDWSDRMVPIHAFTRKRIKGKVYMVCWMCKKRYVANTGRVPAYPCKGRR